MWFLGVGAVVAVVGGVVLWAYMRSAPEPLALEPEVLVGTRGHVVVAVPARGVGAVALDLQGRRVTRACAHRLPVPLSVGRGVRVVDVAHGVLVVEWV